MKTRKIPLALATVILAPMLVTSCANTKLSNSQDLMAAAQQQAAEAQKTPEEMIQIAGERINNADKDLRFYSPIHMKQAQDKLEEARKLSQKSQEVEIQSEALAAAILADQLVDEAENNRVVVKQQLSQALAHRDILIELKSPEVLPKDYNKGMDHLDFLIREVEGGNLDKVAKGQPKLLEEFAIIEADTLRKTWLTAAEVKLEEAEDANAEDLAPKSFEIAETAVDRTDDFIGKNYRDREGVKRKSREAFVLASQALNVAKEVEKLNKKKPDELELYVLDVQSYFDVINRKTGIEELVAQSFYEQSRSIAEVMPEAQRNHATLVTVDPLAPPAPQTSSEPALELPTETVIDSPYADIPKTEIEESESAEEVRAADDAEAEMGDIEAAETISDEAEVKEISESIVDNEPSEKPVITLAENKTDITEATATSTEKQEAQLLRGVEEEISEMSEE